jgi:hypothetical protein
MPSGRYLRITRNITIPAGVTSVLIQARHRWEAYNYDKNAYYDWHGSRKIVLGSQTALNQNNNDAENTWFLYGGTVSTTPGSQALTVGTETTDDVNADPGYTRHHHNYFDDLIITRSRYIEVEGLDSGWKAKLYDASDTLLASATESGGTASIDVISLGFPITGKLKITNGADVVQFTGELLSDNYGGDHWLYKSTTVQLLIATNYYIINKTGGASPTQAVITFTLRESDLTPLSGKTLTFESSLGSLSAASGVTDWNGQAQVILTSAATIGICIVKCSWAGDATHEAMFETLEVSIHDAADAPDSSKDTQLFIQGKAIATLANPIVKSDLGETVLTADIPGGSAEVVAFRDVSFYMAGVLMFQGRIEIIGYSMNTEVTKITARSFLRSLMRIHVGPKTYTAETLSYMVNDILDTWVTSTKQCFTGSITASLGDIATDLELPDDISAYDALTQIVKLAGCLVSVDENRFVNIR